MKSRRLQHRADGVRDRVGRYFSVRAAHASAWAPLRFCRQVL